MTSSQISFVALVSVTGTSFSRTLVWDKNADGTAANNALGRLVEAVDGSTKVHFEYDAKGLLKAAIRDDNPVVYFEHKYLYRRAKGPVPEGDEIVPIGVAATRREGSDATLLTYGAMVTPSLEAADRLAKEGVEVEVIDLRTLMPLRS